MKVCKCFRHGIYHLQGERIWGVSWRPYVELEVGGMWQVMVRLREQELPRILDKVIS